AADLMSRTVASLAIHRTGAATTAMSPGLRSVLTSILERAAAPAMTAALAAPGAAGRELPPTRLSMAAPELVTPPAPSAGEAPAAGVRAGELGETAAESAALVAERYAEQRARIVELQRVAQEAAQRELAARADTLARTRTGGGEPAA